MTGEARQRRKLDLGSAKPSGVSQSPTPEKVREISEDAGFTSRQAKPPAKKEKRAVEPVEPPIGRKRPGPRRKGRTEALNLRVTPTVYTAVNEICEARGYGYSEFLDEALEAWKQVHGWEG